MQPKVSIKLPRRFLERYETIQGHFGYRSFNNFVDHAVQEYLEKKERTFNMYEMEKQEVERMKRQ